MKPEELKQPAAGSRTRCRAFIVRNRISPCFCFCNDDNTAGVNRFLAIFHYIAGKCAMPSRRALQPVVLKQASAASSCCLRFLVKSDDKTKINRTLRRNFLVPSSSLVQVHSIPSCV